MQEVYYYRLSSIQRYLRYTVPGTGYILTEFVQPVGYAQALNAIAAAAGHQIGEARWPRTDFYDDDYVMAYLRGPGNSTQFVKNCPLQSGKGKGQPKLEQFSTIRRFS